MDFRGNLCGNPGVATCARSRRYSRSRGNLVETALWKLGPFVVTELVTAALVTGHFRGYQRGYQVDISVDTSMDTTVMDTSMFR